MVRALKRASSGSSEMDDQASPTKMLRSKLQQMTLSKPVVTPRAQRALAREMAEPIGVTPVSRVKSSTKKAETTSSSTSKTIRTKTKISATKKATRSILKRDTDSTDDAYSSQHDDLTGSEIGDAKKSDAVKKRGRGRKTSVNNVTEEKKRIAEIKVLPLKGREDEFNKMRELIDESMKNKTPLSIYISGSPGTGKTATTTLVMKSMAGCVSHTMINCVSVQTQTQLFTEVFQHLDVPLRPTATNWAVWARDLRRPVVLVLDEIDHLSTRTNSLLYAAFQWPQSLSNNIIIIGIANSIDLTERLLPKLKLALPPHSMVFAPYTKERIAEILADKMNEDDENKPPATPMVSEGGEEGVKFTPAPAVDARAMELCARKVAAMSGDLRSAIHIIKQTKNNASASSTPAGCREVLGVLNSVYSSPLARAKLPLQPRLLLAVCLRLVTKKKDGKAVPLTRTSLFTGYQKACDVLKVPCLQSDDLLEAFQTLESQSFVSFAAAKGLVRIQVDANTARGVIADSHMVDAISQLNL